MNLQALASEFLSSDHGQGALSALASQGFSLGDATSMLTAGAHAAGEHAEDHAQSSGLMGAHPGKSFFAAFAAGLVRGDGFLGALEDGAEGVVVGRVAEAIANKLGISADAASAAAS